MCNLSDIIEQRGIEQGIEKGIERGTENILFSLVKQGLLKIEDAAKQLNMSEEDFVLKMEQTEK